MTVEVGQGVIYHWFDVPEDQLEDIESWTDAAQFIRAVTDDVLRNAIALAPVGRMRDDQAQKIKTSHYKAGTSFAGRFRFRQVVGNRAPHALWVHEGTDHIPRFRVSKRKPMGPVYVGDGPGMLYPGRRPYGAKVFFRSYLWRGQGANPWLSNAGTVAYRSGGNS